ncbi:dispanin subfamily A member 2b-like isoform X1 [Xiphophorus maculatus]|uniref:dispanin subfamily A member 2b-like isoform X1 n=1 Tax=Xiphophorus maculatus TaxID=8083 RepID=UPI0003B4571D|nr:dispanin subfamily A member 2b-like isoform X1 [Xiphophorus maculatus]
MATASPDKGHQPVVVALPQYVGPEVQAQPHMMVHQSAVNIPAVQPSDDIIWSLVCFMYGNPFCLGLAALIFSVKARDRKVVGDLEGARRHGSTARVLNIVATVLTSVATLLTVIVLLALSFR